MYDCQGATYLFDLDYVEDVYTVDAAHQGNVSHFVNHSVSVQCCQTRPLVPKISTLEGIVTQNPPDWNLAVAVIGNQFISKCSIQVWNPVS